VLAFLREATGPLGLGTPEVSGLERAVETVCLNVVERARLRELCRRRIDWIGLDLPLSQPEAGQVCTSLEALGFFFAGIVPDLMDDDVLRLQYLNEIEVDVASAQLASDFGKDLFAYVVRAMGQASATSAR